MSDRESRRGMSRAAARSSRTSRAGLKFPVGCIHRFLRRGNYGRRFSADAPVFLAAVLEYMTAEILFSAGFQARYQNRHRIIPRHIQLAMRDDVEMDELLQNVTIAQGGAVPKTQARPQCHVQTDHQLTDL